MPLTVPNQSQNSNREITPSGNHIARVYRVIHLGTSPEIYMGEEKLTNKVMIGFELLNKKKVFNEEKGEEPFVTSVEYTLSLGEKANLRKFIEGMLGIALHEDEANSFDVFSILGEFCMVNIIHKVSKNGRTYAQVKGASPVPEGMTVPVGYNPIQKLSFSEWDEVTFEKLPKFIQEKIEKSQEFKRLDNNSRIPF